MTQRIRRASGGYCSSISVDRSPRRKALEAINDGLQFSRLGGHSLDLPEEFASRARTKLRSNEPNERRFDGAVRATIEESLVQQLGLA